MTNAVEWAAVARSTAIGGWGESIYADICTEECRAYLVTWAALMWRASGQLR